MTSILSNAGIEPVPPIEKVENPTNKRYTLFVRGVLTLNWDDLKFLEDALLTVPSTRNTYIQYNESGVIKYQMTR